MKKRPLCVALVIVAAAIIFWQAFMPEDIESEDGGRKKIQFTCQVAEISGQGDRISLTVQDVTEGGKPLCSQMKLYAGSKGGEKNFSEEGNVQEEENFHFVKNFYGIKIGNIISVYGEVSPFSKPGNPGQFNEYRYYKEQNIEYRAFAQSLTIEDTGYNKIEQWLHEVRSVLFQKLGQLLPEREAGIITAMTLGEKCALTEDIKELYQENGIAHMLAISGLHISMIGAGLFFLLRRYIMPMKAAVVVTGIFLLMYGELIGFPIATRRAVIMMICVLGARFLGRRYDLFNALALSALIQLFIQPGALFQSGFLLSYGTVFGIAVFVEGFRETGSGKRKLWNIVSGSLGVYLVTLPILVATYYETAPYSAFVNAVILPFAGLLLMLSIAGMGIAFFSFLAGQFFFGAVYYILRYYELVCRFALRLPFARIITGCPAWWQILGYYAVMAGWCLWRKEKKSVWILFLACIILLLPCHGEKGLRITNLDVGQGDCVCIRVDGRTVLVDGGSSDVEKAGKYRIGKYLKYYGIGTIDYIFITHSDSDHTSGIAEIIKENDHMGFQIGGVVLPDIKKQDDNYKQLEKTCIEAGIPVKKMGKGDRMEVNGLTVSCLHPGYSYDWQAENDYSLVLALRYGSFRGLLTGDLGKQGEDELAEEVERADYLKVGHHGSKNSSSEEFLARLRPVISVISAGENNRYGHPAAEVLKRLKDSGSQVYCTSKDGAVTVATDGEKIAVETYK